MPKDLFELILVGTLYQHTEKSAVPIRVLERDHEVRETVKHLVTDDCMDVSNPHNRKRWGAPVVWRYGLGKTARADVDNRVWIEDLRVILEQMICILELA